MSTTCWPSRCTYNQSQIATRLDAVCTIQREDSPTEVDHYQLRKVVDVYVSPTAEDLSKVYAAVKKIIAETKLPENVRVELRGSVQGMESSFSSFGSGLILSVVLVYLILVAQFKSFVDPLIILLAVPTGLTGVLLILWGTGTTLNIMSLMGIVMMVGIVVSNSILIVEFANRLHARRRPLGARSHLHFLPRAFASGTNDFSGDTHRPHSHGDGAWSRQ